MKLKVHLSKKHIAITAAVVVALAAVCVWAVSSRDSEDTTTYTEATAELSTMTRTLTAAGEIKGYKEETIDFNTYKVFNGMCVEENEQVTKGEHLISYSDGTYYDAEYNGVVTDIAAPEAGTYADDTNSITIAKTDKLSLDITVPEDQINDVKVGNSATVIVNADTSKSYTGKITGKKAMSTTLISESASESSSNDSSQSGGMPSSGSGDSSGSDPFGSESSTSYYTVSIEFENDGTIVPGMSANSTITLSERKDVLTIPVEAVYFTDSDKAYVWKGTASDAEKQYVTTGDSDANNVEIKKGLSEGDTVRIEDRG